MEYTTTALLNRFLADKSANTPDTPYEVTISDTIRDNTTYNNFRNAIKNNPDKYISVTCICTFNSYNDFLKDATSVVEFHFTSNLVINSMTSMFQGCTALKDVTINGSYGNAVNISSIFAGCTSLEVAPDIFREGITNVDYTFSYCTALEISPVFPSGILSMNGTFNNCSSLTEVSDIPASVTSLNATFVGCTSLAIPPILENAQGITSTRSTFSNCTALSYRPIIKNDVNYPTFNNVSATLYKGKKDDIRWFASLGGAREEFEAIDIDTNELVYGKRPNYESLNEWLATLEPNEYRIAFLSLYTGIIYSSQIRQALLNNPTKLLDLSYTKIYEYQTVSSLNSLFEDCVNLTKAPLLSCSPTTMKNAFKGCSSLLEVSEIPNTVTDMEGMFYGCSALNVTPVIPSGVTNLLGTFCGCSSLVSAPTIPSGVTNMQRTFTNCAKIPSAPAIPSSVTAIDGCFYGCSLITETPALPNAITDLNATFKNCTSLVTVTNIPTACEIMINAFEGCTSLTTVPPIPEGVTYMASCFKGCSSLVNFASLPSTVATGNEMFKDCTSLRKIDEFQIPLNTLKNNANFQNMFQGCTSLSEIGYVIKESSWHVWRLKFGSNTVEGKVFFDENTSVNIPQTSITKSDLNLPVLTDELWFPHGNDEDETAIDALIVKMLQNKYGVFKKTVLPPDQKNFVMWADDPNNFQTNLPISPQGIFNAVYPIGCVYTQYPSQKSPMEMWSSISTWEILDYGGAFFRSEGGNASSATEKEVTSRNGAVITVPNHGATVGSLVYDPIGNETRTVTTVSGNNLTLNSAFTSTNLTNVLIGQSSANLSHRHGTWTSNVYNTSGTRINNTGAMNNNASHGHAGATTQAHAGSGLTNYASAADHLSSVTGWNQSISSTNTDHTHDMQHKHSISADGENEARPVNYSIKIWKRTA